MKNIHLFPTDKPSRLYEFGDQFNIQDKEQENFRSFNIYITSDEEIKEGDWCIDKHNVVYKQETDKIFTEFTGSKKIILTTDQDLIKDGVQAIPDEFLEWFVKNPSCEEVELNKIYNNYGETDIFDLICTSHSFEYKIIIPKEEPKQEKDYTALLQPVGTREESKQETLEEAAEREFPLLELSKFFYDEYSREENLQLLGHRKTFIKGAKWQSKKMYSEEEVYGMLQKLRLEFKAGVQKWQEDFEFDLDAWFEQFKKK